MKLNWVTYITLNVYFLGLATLSQTVSPLVIPLLVQRFVGESQKATFYGTARLWTLMTALLVQALMGILSDRSTSRFGRRRPFIFVGTLAALALMVVIGFSAGMEGMTGYWFLFAMLILLQIASNIGQAAQQGLIPDLAPENQRGRVSGRVKMCRHSPTDKDSPRARHAGHSSGVPGPAGGRAGRSWLAGTGTRPGHEQDRPDLMEPPDPQGNP